MRVDDDRGGKHAESQHSILPHEGGDVERAVPKSKEPGHAGIKCVWGPILALHGEEQEATCMGVGGKQATSGGAEQRAAALGDARAGWAFEKAARYMQCDLCIVCVRVLGLLLF